MTFQNATLKPERFQVEIPQNKIDQMRELIKLAPLAKSSYETQLEDRSLGITSSFMQKAIPYWRDEYDWNKSQERINQFPHYRVPITDQYGHEYSIHFMAIMSPDPKAIPLMLLHGWPGSFVEFLDIIPILAASKAPAFHLIVPSLPGFGFSSPPSLKRDIEPMPEVPAIMHKLMTGLGFSAYAAQGGDLGSFVARQLAADYPESCKAYHINFAITAPPKDVDPSKLSVQDQKHLQKGQHWRETGNSYGDAHGYRTSTISHALCASPVAMFAWIGEKWLEWTEVDPSLDTICENVSLYWLTETFPTTLYYYRSFKNGGVLPPHSGSVPFGYSLFPQEIFPVPKAMTTTIGNLQWFKEHDKGGHFAAVECPQVLADDIIDCFGKLWKLSKL